MSFNLKNSGGERRMYDNPSSSSMWIVENKKLQGRTKKLNNKKTQINLK